MSVGATVASARLELGVESSGLTRGLDAARSQVNSALGGMQSHASSMMGGISKLLGGLAVGAGVGLAAGFAVAIKSAGDLQQSVANISTIKPSIDTTQVFNALNQMSTKIPQSASQLGDSLYNVFSSMDVTQEQALKLTETFAKGATGAGTDAQTFGTAAMGVMNAYKMSAEDATKVSDIFFNTVNDGVVSGQELAQGLGAVTSSAKSAGLSVEEMGGFIVGITKEGGSAELNMQHLNSLFTKFSDPATVAGFKSLGIAATDAHGNFLPLEDTLGKLKDKLSTMSAEKKASTLKDLFGDATSAAAATTIMSQLDAVRSSIKKNKEESGSTEKAYAKMSQTFNSQLTLAKNTLMSVGTQVGGQLLPKLTPLIKYFNEHLPQAVDFLGKKFNEFAPIILDVFSKVSDWATPILNDFSNTFSFLGNLVGKNSGNIKSAISQMLSYIIPKMQEWGKDIQGFIHDVLPKFQAAVATMTDWVKKHWNEISAVTKAVFDVISFVIKTVLDGIGTSVKIWLDIFSGNWKGVWQDITGFVGRTFGGLIGTVSSIWDAIVAVFRGSINNIIDQINSCIKAFNDLSAMVHGPQLPLIRYLLQNGGSNSDNTGGNKAGGKRASGGPVQAGLTYLVGERGMELFTPRTDGYITPNSALGGGVNGSNQPIIVQLFMDKKMVTQIVTEGQRQYARSNV